VRPRIASDPNAVASGVAASRPIVAVLFGLTFVTGIVDAVSFLGLGHVFTANMTGNVVFVGFALGGAPDLSVLRSVVALVAFMIGGLGGGLIVRAESRTMPARLLSAIAAESALLSAAIVASAGLLPFSAPAWQLLVIVSTAIAMGIRNAVVRGMAIPDMTTTVLTLTVTGLAADSPLAGGAAPRRLRRYLSVMMMLLGALAGAVLLRSFGVRGALGAAVLVDLSLVAYLRLWSESHVLESELSEPRV
jgi:uncharacterized membrane protein YoaK (UPF0700 family)